MGTPIGSIEYTTEKVERRLEEERLLCVSIPAVPDLECAWHILLQSANRRGNHTIRILPPARVEGYAQVHDEGIWSTAKKDFGRPVGECGRKGPRTMVGKPPNVSGRVWFEVCRPMFTSRVLGIVG